MNHVIVPMRREDIPQVKEIELESCLSQWPESAYRREIRNRNARYLVVAQTDSVVGAALGPQPVGVTALAPNGSSSRVGRLLSKVRGLFAPPAEAPAQPRRILGFLGMWFQLNESHITTLAVRKEYRRQGFGESLLLRAVGLALELGTDVLTLEVRVSNLGAQALYKKLGFHQAGVRRGYYSDNKEDALLMTADRITSASFQAAFQRLKAEHTRRWQGDGNGRGLYA